MNKKKKKARPPKGMSKRPQRLLKAKTWLPTVVYSGKRLVHAYARKYHTDLPCSVIELRMLGVAIPGDYEEALKRSLADLALQKQIKKEQKREANSYGIRVDQDHDFSFIAGYTSGGVPYGLCWDEIRIIDDDELE